MKRLEVGGNRWLASCARELPSRTGVCCLKMGRFACTGMLLACCWLGQARGATSDEAMQEARELLTRIGPKAKLDENRFIALALDLAGVVLQPSMPRSTPRSAKHAS